jgi:hypothetical protein
MINLVHPHRSGLSKMVTHKNAFRDVIGKTICSIVFRSGMDVNPGAQLFLVFEGGTYFEIYAQEMNFVRTLSDGDAIKAMEYAKKFSSDVLVVNRIED